MGLYDNSMARGHFNQVMAFVKFYDEPGILGAYKDIYHSLSDSRFYPLEGNARQASSDCKHFIAIERILQQKDNEFVRDIRRKVNHTRPFRLRLYSVFDSIL